MKDIKEYMYEGLLRGQQSTIDNGEEVVYALIEEFLKENYLGKWIISDKPNKDGLYEVSSNERVRVKNTKITSLTNDLFIWTSVKGNFSCPYCKELKSLEGAPKEVGGNFSCPCCNSLKSLEGAPKEVGGNFSCPYCKELKSLEHAPKIVKGDFNCVNCSGLESLEGAPEIVKGDFNCNNCSGLKSFAGAPKKVGCDLFCANCGESGFLTKDDIERISKVNGNIYC